MDRRIAALLVLSLFSSTVFSSATLPTPQHPDPQVTIGELCNTKDQDFRGYRYKEQIPYCERNVSNETKSDIYEYYEVSVSVRREYTIDHFIPLSIGGSNHKSNLWPEHKKIKQLRLNLENELYQAVRDGKKTQDEAVREIIKAKMNPPLLSDFENIESIDSVN